MTFQFGEFYNNSSQFSIIGFLIAIIVAITPFYLGRYHEHEKKYREDKNFITFFFIMLDNLKLKLDNQAKSLEPFIEFIKGNGKKFELLELESGFQFPLLNRYIEQDRFIDVFISKNASLNTNKEYKIAIIEILNSLKASEKTIKSLTGLIEKHNNEYNSQLAKWNNDAQLFIYTYEENISKGRHDDDLTHKNFVDEFSKIHSEINNENFNTEPENVFNVVIREAIRISQEKGCNIYLPFLINAKLDFKNLQNTQNAYIEIFESNKKILEEHSRKLSDYSSIIRKIKIEKKSIFQS